MARRVVVQVNCDICGVDVPSDSTTEFAVGGRSYRADLCPAHREAFLAAFRPFVDVAEVLGGRRPPAVAAGPARVVPDRAFTPRAARRDREQVGAIRTWARANGFAVSARGRIPQAVEDAYNGRGRR
jgi:hypothetical protein